MEKISHRITLDVHKGGIQKVLRGMFTGDVLSRKIVISLVAGSAVCNMDENTTAVMYVTKPSGVTNYGACTVEGNLVTYDILPADIDEPGITQMQLKVVSGEKVLYAPVFSVEAQNNSTSDTPAETSPQFSALEQALAQVEEAYNKRIVSVEVEEDYTFVVTYADGDTYTSEAFKELMEAIETAEHERAEAEVARDVAEENRELAESARVAEHSSMKQDIQSAIDANTALYNRVEELADEGLITESRVIEIIEEQGGGGGTVVLPDNVLVASDVTAADVEAPKINADLFGSLLPSDYAKTTDVNNIKNGTTQVGNALTLDGHGAEYFAPLADLAKYLPLTGGYASGTIGVNKADNTEATVRAGNTLGIIELIVSASGRRGLYDRTNGAWLCDIMPDGTNTFNGTASGNLPLSGGGKVSGANVNPIIINSTSSEDMVRIPFQKNGTTKGFLGFVGTRPAFTNANYNYYELLHTGNKPTGSYTGNGDATKRTINTGGNGIGVVISSVVGTTALITATGGIVSDGTTVKAIGSSNVGFVNNADISIISTDKALNMDGITYTYQVL